MALHVAGNITLSAVKISHIKEEYHIEEDVRSFIWKRIRRTQSLIHTTGTH